MEKVITVCGKAVKLKATALAPRIYRFKFGRDIFSDFAKLSTNYKKVTDPALTEEERAERSLDILDLTIFENLAWVFARQGDPENTPDNPDEWLDSFDGTFSIYEILPEIVELWNASAGTRSTPAKK